MPEDTNKEIKSEANKFVNLPWNDLPSDYQDLDPPVLMGNLILPLPKKGKIPF
jgi:hypothetical protein